MSIQSIQRAADLLKLFSYQQERLGITEMSLLLNLPKGTVQGIARALVQAGFLTQEHTGRKYRLGLDLYQLGTVAAATHELNQKGAGAANHLADRTRLLCRLGVWDPKGPMIILTAVPRANAPHAHQFGPRVPAYCTAIGKALLAFIDPSEQSAYLKNLQMLPYTPRTLTDPDALKTALQQTVDRGYALNVEEIVPGRAGIGLPIYRSGGMLAGAVAVSGGVDRILNEELDPLVRELRETAAAISSYLGHIPGEFQQKTAVRGDCF